MEKAAPRRTHDNGNPIGSRFGQVVGGVTARPLRLRHSNGTLRYSSMTRSAVDVVAALGLACRSSLVQSGAGFRIGVEHKQILDWLDPTEEDEHPDLHIDGRVVQGDAASVLEDASKGAALLVIATRGHRELVGFLLGSVSEHCATPAQCPVLVLSQRVPKLDVGHPEGSSDGRGVKLNPVAGSRRERTTQEAPA